MEPAHDVGLEMIVGGTIAVPYITNSPLDALHGVSLPRVTPSSLLSHMHMA